MIFVSFSIKKIQPPALTVPPLSHLIFCTHTKSNLYLAHSLAAAVSEPALHMLPTFHVPNLMYIFLCLSRSKVSVQVQGTCLGFVTMSGFEARSWPHLAQPPSWRTNPCRLSATAYSIYSQRPSISEPVPLSATQGRAIPWSQGPTCQGCTCAKDVISKETDFASVSVRPYITTEDRASFELSPR